MRRQRQQPDPLEEPDRAADQTFNLRQGLIALVIVITAMVIVTLICTILAR